MKNDFFAWTVLVQTGGPRIFNKFQIFIKNYS